MPYTTSTTTAGEIMRRYNETCTFQKTFINDGIGRDIFFTDFLSRLNIQHTRIGNNQGISIIEVRCRAIEREYIDQAAHIIDTVANEHNERPNEGRAHDWRRYMQSSINNTEARFIQEYQNRIPSETDEAPQQVNSLVGEGL